MKPTIISCSDCGTTISIPAKLHQPSEQRRSKEQYQFLRKHGWHIHDDLSWTCPACTSKRTSSSTSVLPGRLHDKDWERQ